jgi:DNA polymerase III subunit epsilon
MAQIEQFEQMAAVLETHPDYKVLRCMPSNVFDIVAASGGEHLRIAIVDVETTGLQFGRDKIIELGVVVVDVNPETLQCMGVVDAFQGFEDPGFPIPAETTAINGITDNMVAGQHLDEQRLMAMFAGIDLVIAHNAGFDRRFIEQRLPHFEGLNWACSQTQIDWKASGIASAKLDYLAGQLVFFYDAHRAQTDCLALLNVLAAALPGGSSTGMAHLITQSREPVMRIWAINSPFESKDALKDRGHAWDPERRCWSIKVKKADVREEAYWLRDHIYGGREVTLEFEALDAKVLFSNRRGQVARKRVPPMKLAA